jgi:hypothetical protein
MAASYDAAVEMLYRGSLDTFVAERKRLANDLKAGGDKAAAARLASLGRPSISAWAVNQLYWHERGAFDRLLATAERLRRGDLDAGSAHQRELSTLRALAAGRLVSGGHAAAESTLRRVTTSLSALAVAGGFEPDPAGALVADRDPPGFEALGIVAGSSTLGPTDEKGRTPLSQAKPAQEQALDTRAAARREGELAEAKRREQAEQRERAELERKRAADERRRLEEERARKRAEHQRLEAALRVAEADLATHQRDAERLRHELTLAQKKLEKAEASVAELKGMLAGLV